MKKGICNWNEESRPREKLLKIGARNMEVPELLAILIGSGSAEKDAVSLMRDIYATRDNSLSSMARITCEELTAFNGIGEAKAVTIMAALELARRLQEAEIDPKQQFNDPQKLYRFFRAKLAGENRENFWVILLDNRLQRLDDRCLSSGDTKGTVAEPRMIFNYVVTRHATAFAVAHNHPAGSPQPSEADRQLTRRIASVAKELGITFIDHIIVCDGQNNYFSFSEQGLL